jgi:hypothetical protein
VRVPSAQSDALMFEHNRRFQAAVLRTMENQLAKMEAAGQAKDNALQNSEAVREELAIGFGEMRKELNRMNKNYQKTSDNFTQYRETPNPEHVLSHLFSSLLLLLSFDLLQHR